VGHQRVQRHRSCVEDPRRAALDHALSRFVVTGSASGIGAALTSLLRSQGDEVIGIDVRDAEIIADLGTPSGREEAAAGVAGPLDGAVMCAGLVGLTDRPGSLLASVNYFGAVELVKALRPQLNDPSSVVLLSSNSVTIQPGYDSKLVDACVDGDEALARELADQRDSPTAYPATKAALARWVRRNAPAWVADGIRLNDVAPGMVETPLSQEVRDDPNLSPLMAAMPLPVGRGAEPMEIAHLIAFLLGEHGRFFCGSVVLCDGGTEALLRPDDWPARWG
jgi:NAD(P)-dependent dehydrogenase (short-subunit alcohol dehydrogenase family)